MKSPFSASQETAVFEAELIRKCEEVEGSKISNTPGFLQGGVPGFSSGTTPLRHVQTMPPIQEPAPQVAPTLIDEDDNGEPKSPEKVHHELPEQDKSFDSNTTPLEETKDLQLIEVHVIFDDAIPCPLTVAQGTTAGQLVLACCNLAEYNATDYAIQTGLGTQVALASTLMPDDVVKVVPIHEISKTPCQIHLPWEHRQKVSFPSQTRERLLWAQQGWVALDEMQFYLSMLSAYPVEIHAPIHVLDNGEAQLALCQIILNVLQQAGKNQTLQCIPVLYCQHWFPIAALPTNAKPTIVTTTMQAKFLRDCVIAGIGHDAIEVMTRGIGNAFAADCGFQTVGWIIEQAIGETQVKPITPEQASHWRKQFHEYLRMHNIHQVPVTTPLPIGGMNVADELSKLVQSHGVSASRSKECTEQLISVLGVQAIQKVLSSPKAWAELKTKASMSKPPIRIVTTEELKAMISQRMQEDRPVGKKSNKTKGKSDAPVLRLRADQIAIPAAVFRQQNGAELAQIGTQQLGANARSW
eukprot:s267_g15.t1